MSVWSEKVLFTTLPLPHLTLVHHPLPSDLQPNVVKKIIIIIKLKIQSGYNTQNINN